MAAENALLIALNISSYSARRYDRKVSDEVAKRHKTNEKVGRYNKCLIDPDADSFKTVNKAAQEARDYHYVHTLPWAQDGARILPKAEHFEYMTAMRELQEKFHAAVDVFVADFPRLREEARTALNGLFKESDYPSEGGLRRRFEFRVVPLPLPEADDFRVSLGEVEVAAIKEQITDEVQSAFAAANRDLWERLHGVVKHMAESLSDPKKRFTETLVSNASDLVDLLPRLNLTNDARLEEMRQLVEKQLIGATPQTLREDMEKRAQVAARAKAIEAQMAAFMGAGR